jgi:hypothetical protein
MADLNEFPDAEIDYGVDNSEFISNDEKRRKFMKTINGLTLHVMHSMTDAGMEMAKDAPIENDRFNSELDIPDLFGNKQDYRRTRRDRKSI